MDEIHECELLKKANNHYKATIYKIDEKWYFKIKENDKEEKQEILYCPYCSEMLN